MNAIRKVGVSLFLAVAVAGCPGATTQDSGTPEDGGIDSGQPFDAGQDAGDDDAGTDGGQDAGPTCAAGSHLEGSECRSSIAWTQGPPLPYPRDHHATFIVDKGDPSARFLYVAGGFSQASASLLKSVVRAPILDDGGLGDWVDGGSLVAGVAGMGVAQTDDEVFFAGGFNSQRTWVAHINSDGTLGAFAQGPSLDAYCFHTTASLHGGYLYVVGGLNVSVTTDEVQRAQLEADGGLGPFQVVQHLPYSLSHHVTIVDGDTLWVLGGQTGNPNDNSGLGHDDVIFATFDGDGGLSEFQPALKLPLAAVTSAGALYQGQLHVLGGITGGAAATSEVPSAAVYQARVTDAGSTGPWVERTESVMPAERSHVHHAPIWNGHIYFISGMTNFVDSPDTFLGTFY